jgi:hypothetical protein
MLKIVEGRSEVINIYVYSIHSFGTDRSDNQTDQ